MTFIKNKKTRREFLEQSLLLSASTQIYFPVLSSFLPDAAYAQLTDGPKMITYVYGEGVCQLVTPNSLKKTYFTEPSGKIIDNNISKLTLGHSGLGNAALDSLIIQNVGSQHNIASRCWQGIDREPRSCENHQILTVAALNGHHRFDHYSFDTYLKLRMGKKVIAFNHESNTLESPFGGEGRCVTTGLGSDPTPPESTFHGLITSLGLNQGGGGNPNPPPASMNANRRDALKKLYGELITISTGIKSSVNNTDRGVLNNYEDLITTLRDQLTGGGGGGGGSPNCGNVTANSGTDNFQNAFNASKIMLKAMSCNALHYGVIVVYPTNCSTPMFKGFQNNDPLSYQGIITDLGVFLKNNMPQASQFLSSFILPGLNHHVLSHASENVGRFNYPGMDVAAIYQEGHLAMDYALSVLHRITFEEAQKNDYGNLMNSFIMHSTSGAAYDHLHRCANIKEVLTSKGDYFKKNHFHAPYYSGLEMETIGSAHLPNDPHGVVHNSGFQRYRTTEFWSWIAKIFNNGNLPADFKTYFTDVRDQFTSIDLKTIV